MLLTNDAPQKALTVTKKDESNSIIKMYDIDTGELMFEEWISGTYIKVKEVEQNQSGTKFALVYNDDGVFKLRIFTS